MDKERIDVLLVEDDEDDYFITRSLLNKATGVRYALDWVRTYDEGLEAVLTESYDVCLVDYCLGTHNGLDLMQAASDQGCLTPIILLTGQGDLEVDLNAMMKGAADYLVKDKIDADLLERSIRYARERQRAEQRIREQAQLLDKARDAISAYDMDGQLIYWNKSAEQLTGWSMSEMRAMEDDKSPIERLYGSNPEQVKQAYETVYEEQEWNGELTLQTKEGHECTVESRWSLVCNSAGEPESILVIDTDITERKQLEKQFLRSQRMESIGRLVGGIAHDLGNLLVPVLLGVEVLQDRIKDDERSVRTLEMIQKSAKRGSEMVKQVLAFARGVEGDRVPVELSSIVSEVERIAEETFPPDIEVTIDIPDDLWKIKGDATQVQQVLVNLCTNARDAMPDGGHLRIEAENAVFEEDSSLISMEAEPGAYVSIVVSDTGEGIEEEHLDKIFEPFFTTKPTGKGTGLGLSTVYSIVKSHGGFVEVASQRGGGTAFSVHLPVAKESEEHSTEELHMHVGNGNGELILLVDDAPFVNEVAKEMLQRTGYKVLTASDAREAMEILASKHEKIDVLVTDLIMPGIHGLDLVRHVRETHADLPVIVSSSPTDNQGHKAQQAGADYFLAKPFTAERLCAALHKVLAKQPARVQGG